MKKILVALLALIASVGFVMACPPEQTCPTPTAAECPDGVCQNLCDGATCYDNIIIQTDYQTADSNILGDCEVPDEFTQAGFVFAGTSGVNNYVNEQLIQNANANTVSGKFAQVGGVSSVITSNQNVVYKQLHQTANNNIVENGAEFAQLGLEVSLIEKDRTYLNQYAQQQANSNYLKSGKFTQADIKAAMVVCDPANVKNVGLLFDPTKIVQADTTVPMDP